MNHLSDTRVLIHRGTGTCWESLDLHTCKFDFRNADFLHIKYKNPKYITAMSDVISRYMQRSYEWKIFGSDSTLSYIKQEVNISDLLLKIWHENVQDGCDYIDFLNATVSRSWFRVSWETGYPVQGRLEREARVVASKYSQTKGRKREQLWSKYITLSILHSELMSIEGVERNLHLTREELSDLTCIHLKFYHLSKAENQGK